MSMQDTISDMLTRIRNGYMGELNSVSLPTSKMKESMAGVLKEEGYIKNFEVVDSEGASKTLTIELKYYKNKPVIEGIKRVSKPSCRIYCGCKDIPRVRNGLGTVLLSTPAGVISDKAARKQNVGGEVLCYVW